MVYSLTVDTMDFDLLILRYAAVLQVPYHAPADQPRFRIEILDTAFHPLDTVCAAADFIADRSLGWNEADDDVLWKDWTAVGLDVSPYAGQTVLVRLTTYDCNEGSHYGYAYCTLGCMRKQVSTLSCDVVDSITFTAPAGFNYLWTDALGATVSTGQSVTLPASDATYSCRCSKVDADDCAFFLSAYSGTRLPVADFDTAVAYADCHIEVAFSNRSFVSSDGEHPAGSGEGVESAHWDFGNGLSSDSYHGHTVYSAPGTYEVTLVARLADGACTDTLRRTLVVGFPDFNPHLDAPAHLCLGQVDSALVVGASPLPPSPSVLPLVADSLAPILLALPALDPAGCPVTLRDTIPVFPTYSLADTLVVCSTQFPVALGDTTFLPGSTTGLYARHFSSVQGCDSVFSIRLEVADAVGGVPVDTLVASVCSGRDFPFHGRSYSDSGFYVVSHIVGGVCDSVHYLRLSVAPDVVVDTFASACDSFAWRGILYTAPGRVASLTLPGVVGCDTLLTLDLDLRLSSSAELQADVVENSLPFVAGGVAFNASADTLFHLVNAAGCDSSLHLVLRVFPNGSASLDSTVCPSALPLVWNGVTFPAAGTRTVTLLTTQGADSTVTMTLHVLANSSASRADTIVENQLPYSVGLFGHQLTFAAATDTLVTGVNAAGCDSLLAYSLVVHPNVVRTFDTVVCANGLPILFHGHLFTAADSLRVDTLAASGADSTVRLFVDVLPVFESADTLVFCNSDAIVYHGVDYGSPTVFDTLFRAQNGCDSLVHVALTIRDSSFRLSPLVSTDGEHWLPVDSLMLGCDPTTLWLRDTTPGRDSLRWSLVGDSLDFSSTDTLCSVALVAGRYSLRLVETSLMGCVDSVTLSLRLFGTPRADFRWVDTIPTNVHPDIRLVNLSQAADTALPGLASSQVSYLWQIPPSQGSADYDTFSLFEPRYSWDPSQANTAGEYIVNLVVSQLYVVDSLHSVVCADTASDTIVVTEMALQFPNLVTPNGDGENDVWRVVNLLEYGNYSMNELWIYSRYGSLVHHARNIRAEELFWDPLATRSPDGTYYFHFQARSHHGGMVKRSGVIEVVR